MPHASVPSFSVLGFEDGSVPTFALCSFGEAEKDEAELASSSITWLFLRICRHALSSQLPGNFNAVPF